MDDKGLLAAIKDFQNRTGGFGADDDYTAIKGAIAAYLAALSTESGEAEGMVLVPREPTEAMLATQGKSHPEKAKTDAARRMAETLNAEMRRIGREVWLEMIAAAPTSEGSHHD